LQFTYPEAFIKDAQAIGVALSPRENFSTSKHEISLLFRFSSFVGYFRPPGFGSGPETLRVTKSVSIIFGRRVRSLELI
jgi:hypothetical protein